MRSTISGCSLKSASSASMATTASLNGTRLGSAELGLHADMRRHAQTARRASQKSFGLKESAKLEREPRCFGRRTTRPRSLLFLSCELLM